MTNHGIARTSSSLRHMERALRAGDHAVLNLDYPSRHMPLGELAELIRCPIVRFADGVPGATHIVAHSMGGLLTRIYLRTHRPERFGRVVMLGMPNSGSEVADRLLAWPLSHLVFGPAGRQLATVQDHELTAALGDVDYPLRIVAGDRPISPRLAAMLLPGSNDGVVTVASTRLAGMADHRVIHASHRRLTSHPEAIGATRYFLCDGRF